MGRYELIGATETAWTKALRPVPIGVFKKQKVIKNDWSGEGTGESLKTQREVGPMS